MGNWPDWLPLREDLRSLSAYGAPQIENVLHLNTNENPYPLPSEVSQAIISRIGEVVSTLNRYPDRDAIRLRSLLSGYINSLSKTAFSELNIWAANGSNEVLQTLLLACGGGASLALGFTPSYSVHPLIARITGTPWQSGHREKDFGLDVKEAINQIREIRPRLIFITTPNNPSGTITTFADLELLAIAAKEISALLIVDEAYQEFSDERSAVELINEYPHVVVTRTMSKAFAFAGARVGYLIARSEVIEAMLIARLPYHLSALTQAVAEVAIEHRELLQAEVQALVAERIRVAAEMSELGLEVVPSGANFLLFSGFSAPSEEIWQRFLDHGVLIRDVGLPGYLRTTIGTESENNRFLTVLKEVK
ncbi:MAG: histidinol-phosphate transaminase [Actinomycetes bacterium]